MMPLQKEEIKKWGLFLITITSLTFSAWASAIQPKVSTYLLKNFTSEQVQVIAKRFEVTPVFAVKSSMSKEKSMTFQVYVSEKDRLTFLKLAPQATLLQEDSSLESRKAFEESRTQVSGRSGLSRAQSGYHSLDEVQRLMAQFAAKSSKITQLIQYGVSQEQRPLLALRVSNHLNDGKRVPRVMLTAATHGDEIITTEILLSLMDTFLSGAEKDPRFLKFIENLEVVFIPVVNPDGFVSQNRYDNGRDPNRSFPYPEKPTESEVQPTASTRGVIQFVKQYPIKGSIDFHAFGRLVMYPWGYTHASIPQEDKNLFEAVTSKMAATNGSRHGPIADVIYVAQGSSADYYYWKSGAFSLGIEVGDSKAPRASQIPQYVKDQAESTWIYLDSFHDKDIGNQ